MVKLNTYRLVNPYIVGDMQTEVKARNSVNAAKELYKNLSEHVNNNIPEFHITIQKGVLGKGKYYSFRIREEKDGDKVSTSFKPVSLKDEDEKYRGLERSLKDFASTHLTGGAKKSKKSKSKPKKSKSKKSIEDDDEDIFNDDDSEDFYKRTSKFVPILNHPIDVFYYNPHLYRPRRFYVPTFYSYLTPYILLAKALNPPKKTDTETESEENKPKIRFAVRLPMPSARDF